MAKSGFVPAWMKLPSSDKTTSQQKLNIDRTNSRQLQNETNPIIITGRQRHHSSEISDHTTTRHTLFYYSKTNERCRNKSSEQTLSNDFDEQPENFFSFQPRRSYSRERSSNSFGKNSEFNVNDLSSSINSNTTHQRRLHSVSSSISDRLTPNNHQSLINGNSLEHLTNDNHEDNYLDMTIKTNENTLDQLEKDFPSLSGCELSSNNNEQSTIWKNAASKFRISNNEISPFKYFDRSLSTNNGNFSRTFDSNRLITRKDRLLSTPNNLTSTSSINNRSIVHELQTNCITQTKNLDKRSDFFNSLKNDSKNTNGNKRHYSESSKSTIKSDENYKTRKGTLLLLSVPETSEEKELLIRMGWNDADEITYEITDKDKEEYEKRIKLLPKTDSRSTTLMSALNRRALPCINIQDILRLEMIVSTSDDDSSDE